MDLDSLRIFYVVAKEKQITSAANLLGKTQPTISERLKKLQADLGVQLYVIGKHGIYLTPQGQILFEKAQQIISDVENLKSHLKYSDEAKGQLKVSTTHALASQLLMQALPQFMEKYPEIDLAILANDVPVDITMREADVVIRPYIDNAPHLEQELLQRCHVRLFASEEYLKRNGIPQSRADLENHILIAYPEETAQPYSGINWHLNLAPRNKRFSLKINSSHAMQKAAELGIGIIALSEEAILFNNTKVIRVLPEVEGPIVDIYYIYAKEAKGNKRISSLYHILKQIFSERNLLGY